MTTDITALVQRLKVAAKNGCCHTLFPDDCLSLVDALEKAQAKADVYDMLRDDYGLREKGVGLADFVDWQAKRIAELESRTVKLPPKIERNDADGWFMYNGGRVGGGAAEWYNKALDDVGAELTAAGIKVEAE
ncbi:hypothetical protein U4P14_10370 [Klebsiella pneumoniae]|uniref:hypothetical protein n=1 Tax=Klebsiella pneumoniae TaxID=573 RepID=UPI002FE064CC